MGPFFLCKIEHEWNLRVTFSVFCQHRGVSGGLTRKIKENLFFFFDFLTILSIFLNTSVSRNDQMVPLTLDCHMFKKWQFLESPSSTLERHRDMR